MLPKTNISWLVTFDVRKQLLTGVPLHALLIKHRILKVADQVCQAPLAFGFGGGEKVAKSIATLVYKLAIAFKQTTPKSPLRSCNPSPLTQTASHLHERVCCLPRRFSAALPLAVMLHALPFQPAKQHCELDHGAVQPILMPSNEGRRENGKVSGAKYFHVVTG
eukprot:569062-Pelagomonas_calceolata.AAC.3